MRCAPCFTKKEAHHDRSRTARNPKDRTMLKMQVQIRRGSYAFANMICINRTQERGNPKNQEINPSSRAAFYAVRVDLLDDTVRNHRGARSDTEQEHCDMRRNWQGFEGNLAGR